MYQIKVIFKDETFIRATLPPCDATFARHRWNTYCDDYLDNPDCVLVQLLHDGEVVCQKAQDYSEGYKA